ncbi:SPFH/Band 7/PHB domain protein [Citricoccus nitrophenolicus]|uniref:Regulator of protease activity HflC (Stomatin/prohibitin superfamily) n=1 Tax=Citricoccus muralis TaxID=169134 RepID=A0A3D9LBT0_9MICC|nr:SPFH domain-containing protein [Citricoccus muralis]REE03116.1 regulator of protease activity HflC (stomatin/prohibitin superfamily) [Citricoccus muralis]
MEVLIVLIVVAVLVAIILIRAVRIVPQARTGIVERLGKYQATKGAGLTLMIPFIDRMRPLIDMREQVVSFPPQPVITEDNLVVSIDTVVYFQVNDAKAATYEINNYIHAVEQLTTTTLRNVVGGMNLEQALTSRDSINNQLRGVLDEATGKWGLRVSRVELKAIDPPLSIQDSMEKQMRAERDRRAAILTAEGTKQAEILTAEGQRQSAILEAEGDAQSRILRANAEAEAIHVVFEAIHEGRPDPDLLAYKYLETLPKIAEGDANTMWVIPAELTDALGRLGDAFGGSGAGAGVPGLQSPSRNSESGSADGSDEADDEDRQGEVTAGARRRRREPRPTTAAELNESSQSVAKIVDTPLEEALAPPAILEDEHSETAERALRATSAPADLPSRPARTPGQDTGPDPEQTPEPEPGQGSHPA